MIYARSTLNHGYANRILTVDLGTGAIETPELNPAVRDYFIGGRGLGLYLLHKATTPATKASDPENPLILANGPLGGIPQFPGTAKAMAVSLSPLTGIPGVSNFGGYFGAFLKFAGFDALKAEVSNNLLLLELARFEELELRKSINELIKGIYTLSASVSEVVEKCSGYIFENFSYIKGITSTETTVAEILEHRSGVCQDFAHVMLEMLRNLQIPCRYVSGYICPNKNGMRGEGATHAWVEAWIPATGWAGIDPTNNIWVTNHHVKLAVGRNFNDCSPIKGSFKGPAHQSLSVFVSIGYEDGQTFEEVTSVKLEEQPGIPEIVDELETIAGQQQQ